MYVAVTCVNNICIKTLKTKRLQNMMVLKTNLQVFAKKDFAKKKKKKSLILQRK
jgi:hypothetical protein